MDKSQNKTDQYLDKVILELQKYEHPLFTWTASATKTGIEVIVSLKMAGVHEDSYRFHLLPRELDSPAFAWDFQRQLYNYLHDYLIEMFTRSPQIIEY
jgi:hypothetical protein